MAWDTNEKNQSLNCFLRSKPPDTKISKCWSWFGCRRRTICGKITPIIIQVIVITVVWFFIKKSCYTPYKHENVISTRTIKSSNDQEFSMYSNGEYVKGSALRIEDIVSVSGSLEPNLKQKRFFLQVDVLTRNTENDPPTLYTVGTPVIIDGLFKDEDSDKLTDKEKAEFYYDNNLVEKDSDEYSDPVSTNPKIIPEIVNSQGTKNNFDTKSNVASVRFQGDTNGKQIVNDVLQNVESNHAATAPRGPVFQNFNINSNNEQHLSPEQINSPSVQMGQPHQQELGIRGVQNQPGQYIQSSLQNQYQQNVIRSQIGTIQEPNVNQIRQVNQLLLRKIPGNAVEQNSQLAGRILPPDLGDPQIGLAANYFNDQSVDGPGEPVPENNDVAEMDQAQDINSRGNIQSEGFKDRLTRFKTEFYGKPVDDSHDQTTTSYAINNPTLCEGKEKVDVLFLINTIPQSNEQRQRIRDTFVKTSLFQEYAIAHLFLVGLTSSPNFQGNLNREHEQFNDIVQGEFTDKPETRTVKGLMGFRWVITYCPQASFVFKIDEDVFVDTEKLLQGLIPATSNIIGQNAMLCYFIQNAPIPRTGPNAFDRNLFPKSSRMRPYCKGFAVLTTVSTITNLVSASEHVPLFQFDDLYLYGILPFVAGGIEVYDLGNKRAFHDFGMAVVNCYKELQDSCQYVATKAFSSRFTSLWEFITGRRTSEPDGFQTDPSLWNIEEYRSTFYS